VGLYEKSFSYRYFLVFYGYTFKEKILKLKNLNPFTTFIIQSITLITTLVTFVAAFILIWIVTVMSMFKIFGHNIRHSPTRTVSSSYTVIFWMAFPHPAIIFYLFMWTSFKYFLLSHRLFIYGFKNLILYIQPFIGNICSDCNFAWSHKFSN